MELTGEVKDAVSAAQRSISEREREILVLVAQGFTNAEIGECLYITRLTVRTHLENIYAKLCVRDRTQAVVRYFFFAESEKIIGDAYLKWSSERDKKWTCCKQTDEAKRVCSAQERITIA